MSERKAMAVGGTNAAKNGGLALNTTKTILAAHPATGHRSFELPVTFHYHGAIASQSPKSLSKLGKIVFGECTFAP